MLRLYTKRWRTSKSPNFIQVSLGQINGIWSQQHRSSPPSSELSGMRIIAKHTRFEKWPWWRGLWCKLVIPFPFCGLVLSVHLEFQNTFIRFLETFPAHSTFVDPTPNVYESYKALAAFEVFAITDFWIQVLILRKPFLVTWQLLFHGSNYLEFIN